MDNINIEFCPYRLYSPLACIFGVAGIFCIMLLGRFWEIWNILELLSCGILASLFIIAMKYSYDLTKVTVFFESQGLRLINDRRIKYNYVSYQNLTCGYYCRSYRGDLFLVLSREPLTEKQLKRIANKNMFLERLYVEDAIVISIKREREEELFQIKEIISKKVLFIEK